jgi:leucyl aminopeptidase
MRNSFLETAPSVYEWLSNITVAFDDNVNGGTSLTVVPVELKSGKKIVQEKLGGLSVDVAESLNKNLEGSPWQGKSGNAIFTIEGRNYICVAYPKASNSFQCSREFGLNVSAEIKTLKTNNLVIPNSTVFNQGQVFIGLVNGLYTSSGFKEQKEEMTIGISGVTFSGGADKDQISNSIALVKSQLIARHLGDAPANWLNPVKFAQVAEELSSEFGYKLRVLDKEQIIKEKMGSLMAVAQGSDNDPRVIIMEIEGEDNSKTAALVGKGLTFDSGGISLKPGAGMEEMKYDMCGGAAVFGAACYLAQVKPKNKVVALIGAVENMPGSNATRPGDVVKARNGKTVEVINTDAEGRLVLIDVLDYAITTYKPDLLVNTATLTGACLVALGSVGAAVLSKKQNVANMLLDVSQETGEPLWQLPLWEELFKELKSDVADYKNLTSGSVKAGTITAGGFLSEFVGDSNWAHVDIAGTGWNCAANGYPRKGGSGYGVALLANACLKLENI